MKLFMKSLNNGRKCKIFLDMENVGDILLHFRDGEGHITGYYLIGINADGMFLIGSIGETDFFKDNIGGIDLDYEESKLKIIGFDMV